MTPALARSEDPSPKDPEFVPVRPPSWRIPAIDGFRALAMLMVFACHAWTFSHSPTYFVPLFGTHLNLFGPFAHASNGVNLFMVLSGFCLFFPLCKSQEALARFEWRTFYKRRLRRIVPPYYAAIAFATLLPMALVVLYRLLHLEAKWQPLPATPLGYLTHLLFLHTLVPGMANQVSLSLWSMGLEMQFYCLFPLVIWGIRRYGLRFVGGMIAVSVLYCLLVFPQVPAMSAEVGSVYVLLFLAHWYEFAAGLMAAWVVAHHRRNDLTHAPRRGSVGVLGAVLLYTVATSFSPAIPLSWLPNLGVAAAFAVAIVSVCITRTPFVGLLENPVMERLGYISYSIFLIHWPVAYYVYCLLERFHLAGMLLFAGTLLGGFVVTLALAYPFFLLFERPFLNAPTPERRASVRALLSSLRYRNSDS